MINYLVFQKISNLECQKNLANIRDAKVKKRKRVKGMRVYILKGFLLANLLFLSIFSFASRILAPYKCIIFSLFS